MLFICFRVIILAVFVCIQKALKSYFAIQQFSKSAKFRNFIEFGFGTVIPNYNYCRYVKRNQLIYRILFELTGAPVYNRYITGLTQFLFLKLRI